MVRSFPASPGEGRRSCPNSHTAPAASHALQASEGHAGDSKRHRQKPRLRKQEMSPGQSHCKSTPTEHPNVSGCWQKAETWHHSSHRWRNPAFPTITPCQGRAGAPLSLSPAGSARLPMCCHIQGSCRTAPKVEDSPGTDWENWISISHPVLCRSHVTTLGSLHHHPSTAEHGQRLPSPTSDWLHRGI